MDESPPESDNKPRRQTWKQVPGITTPNTPVSERFDPPLEHRPYEEVMQEVRRAMRAIEHRMFRRRKGVR